MKNQRCYRKKAPTLALAYAVCWLLSVCLFWLAGRTNGSATMLYGILVQYILLPVVTFAISLGAALGTDWKTGYWGLAPLLGFAYSAIWLFTFGLANTVSGGNWHLPLMEDILFGGAVSAAGLLVGRGLHLLRERFPRR